MSHVVVARISGGPVVKVCESWDAFDEWFDKYGHKSFDRENLDTVEAKVFEARPE